MSDHPAQGQPLRIEIVDRRHPLRAAAEAHVRAVYRRSYGATVRAFAELLAVLPDDAGKPGCVAGVRYGLTDCFSERYLDRPIERVLSELSGEPVTRARILEVTTLACDRPNDSFRLVREVIELGRRQGMRWGVFTATRKLRHALPRLGLTLIEIAPARRERAADPQDWGSYYDTDPWVCAMADRAFSAQGAAGSEAA